MRYRGQAMRAVHQPTSSRPGREPGALLVPIGVIITLIGAMGELLSHAHGAGSRQEELIVLGAGTNPWHVVLFAGIVVTAIGGIRWAARLRSEAGAVLGAVMVLLLGAVTILGAWTGWKARTPSDDTPLAAAEASVADAGARSDAASGMHAHADANGAGAEGASFLGDHDHASTDPEADEAATLRAFPVLKGQLVAAKAATAKYRDVEAARADGYIQVTQFIPTLGLHLAKVSQYSKPFDPATPSVLLYQPNISGDLELVGVAYSLAKTSETPPEGFAGSSDHWHYHKNLCFLLNGTVTITPTQAGCSAIRGIFEKETNWLLHAWIWKANPAGMFVEANANVF